MKHMLITGGAGFIGTNAASSFYKRGWRVTVVDNLSRKGSGENAAWLRNKTDVIFKKMDIRNKRVMESLFMKGRFDAILHLAAQVAVTTSIADPRTDFEINALGTINVIEATRRFCPEASIIYASTNKVYGQMEEIAVTENNGRYEYQDLTEGISEEYPLNFQSPYGCSKGCADQYVLDYARMYSLQAASFRQSCIYGPRQFGIEDQGWVAWFVIAAVTDRPITIYGDGKQIRDILYVDDLIRAFELAATHPKEISGQAFNIGGGPGNTLSLTQLIKTLESKIGRKLTVNFGRRRPHDQQVFVSNVDKINRALSWRPEVDIERGLDNLIGWVKDNKRLFL